MGNISTATESSFDVLESYFKKYPDVPKETILKQHMLSLGHWFSDAALDASAGALLNRIDYSPMISCRCRISKETSFGECRSSSFY